MCVVLVFHCIRKGAGNSSPGVDEDDSVQFTFTAGEGRAFISKPSSLAADIFGGSTESMEM